MNLIIVLKNFFVKLSLERENNGKLVGISNYLNDNAIMLGSLVINRKYVV